MSDTFERNRRLIRRGILTVSGIVLLVSGYVGAWLAVSKAVQVRASTLGMISPIGSSPPRPRFQLHSLSPAFRPIVGYSRSTMPGAECLRQMWWWAVPSTEEGAGGRA